MYPTICFVQELLFIEKETK